MVLFLSLLVLCCFPPLASSGDRTLDNNVPRVVISGTESSGSEEASEIALLGYINRSARSGTEYVHIGSEDKEIFER